MAWKKTSSPRNVVGSGWRYPRNPSFRGGVAIGFTSPYYGFPFFEMGVQMKIQSLGHVVIKVGK